MSTIRFRTVITPSGKVAYIPDDINIAFPSKPNLSGKIVQPLAYIPWDKKYLSFVPSQYEAFYKYLLPNLHARTTDVHTAICLPLLDLLLKNFPMKINKNVVYLGLILHDVGWSMLSDKEIADSLSYHGLRLSSMAKAPKNKHAKLGALLAKKILADFKFTPPLNPKEIKQILDIILYHDITPDLISNGTVTPELYLVSDADRLWSYTHENFWQDTIRKNVQPVMYLDNLSNELKGYFYTPQGKDLAKKLLSERELELNQYPR